jgi:hypothetical protein
MITFGGAQISVGDDVSFVHENSAGERAGRCSSPALNSITFALLAVAGSVLFFFVFNVPAHHTRRFMRCCVAYVAFKPSPDEDVELKYARVGVFALQTKQQLDASTHLREVWKKRADWQNLIDTALEEASECVDVPQDDRPAPVSVSRAPVARPAQAPAPKGRPSRTPKTPDRLDTTPAPKKLRIVRTPPAPPKTPTAKKPATPPKPESVKEAPPPPRVTPPRDRPLTVPLGASAGAPPIRSEAVIQDPVRVVDEDVNGERAWWHGSDLIRSIAAEGKKRKKEKKRLKKLEKEEQKAVKRAKKQAIQLAETLAPAAKAPPPASDEKNKHTSDADRLLLMSPHAGKFAQHCQQLICYSTHMLQPQAFRYTISTSESRCCSSNVRRESPNSCWLMNGWRTGAATSANVFCSHRFTRHAIDSVGTIHRGERVAARFASARPCDTPKTAQMSAARHRETGRAVRRVSHALPGTPGAERRRARW